jgi:hypothetical protein
MPGHPSLKRRGNYVIEYQLHIPKEVMHKGDKRCSFVLREIEQIVMELRIIPKLFLLRKQLRIK